MALTYQGLKVWTIVLAVYSGLLTGAILVVLLFLFIIKRKKSSKKQRPSTDSQDGVANQGFRPDGLAISSERLRGDLEAQRKYRKDASPIPPKAASRFHTGPPDAALNRVTYLEMRGPAEDFASLRSFSTNSASTLYDDVQSVESKSKTSLREGRSSVSSAVFYDARDVDYHEPEKIYQEISEETLQQLERKSSSGSQIYDDAQVVKRSRKKGPPPAPPVRKPKQGSDSSSNSTVELRDIEEARRSFQAAPEQYRKESSYLTLEPVVPAPGPQIEPIIEDQPMDEEDSSSSSSSSTSDEEEGSHKSPPRRPTTSESSEATLDLRELEPSAQAGLTEATIEVFNSSSSSENLEKPKFRFVRRKSSYSSASENMEVMSPVEDEVFSFSHGKQVSIDDDEGSTNDSSSSSQGSFHIQLEDDQGVSNTPNRPRPIVNGYNKSSSSSEELTTRPPLKQANAVIDEGYEIQMCTPAVIISDGEDSSSTSSSSSEGDEDMKQVHLKYQPPRMTMSLDRRQPVVQRSESSSSSSASSDKAPTNQLRSPRLVQSITSSSSDVLRDSFLRKLNSSYEPVYVLRKVNSTTQTPNRSNSTEMW